MNHNEIQDELRRMRELECKLSKNKEKDKLKELREELFHIPPIPPESPKSSTNEDMNQQLQKKSMIIQGKQSKIKSLKRQLRRRETKLEETETKSKGGEQRTTRLKRVLSSKDAEIAKREAKIQS